MRKYAVVYDVGMNDGAIYTVDCAEAFSSDNPEGWTDQQVAACFSNFATVKGYYEMREEAESILRTLLS